MADAAMPPPRRDHRERLERDERLRAFMRHGPMLAYMKDEQGRVLYVNPHMEQAFGLSLERLEGNTHFEGLPAAISERLERHDREVLSRGEADERIETIPAVDGRTRHWMVLRFPFSEADGPRILGAIAVDVTALKQAETQVGESALRYRHLVESGQGLICTHDLDGTLLSVNPGASKVLGYSAEELVGRNLRELLTDRGRELFHRYLERINHAGSDSGLMFVRIRNGDERTWHYHNVKVTDSNQPPYILGLAHDVTELREAQEHLKTLSLTDELTGLANRRGFFTLASRLLKGAARPPHEFTVVYADVDGLKTVNDTYGHDAGSAILVGAADVLKNTFRAADVVARIGGDEFVAIAAISRAGASVISERLAMHLAHFNARSGLPATLSLSVGMAHFDPSGTSTLEDVVTQADQAMYEQKRTKARRG